ncbi:PLP-dependent aminotransferase family protein [Paenibacillus physcomitrellae]|uniref:GntR family transcriptional regulator n=1 Tax=Paenibacillus physcomitrellae TaxID=1619311 RepID=A0ABQ1FT25_9BACL|nr:PLP-dependent aminotransferase family protein [Paenibacillus physcomitrellae]GGA29870.1 GntR family transcriptional regulator [Paenibacillus physcomitrellae]
MYIPDWQPDKLSTTPLYLQIKLFLLHKIQTGEWPVGSRIPPQRVMADAWNVNRSTIVTAVEELIAEGLLEGKRGQGTVVVNNSWSLLASPPPPDWNAYVQSGIHPPNVPAIQIINKAEFIPGIIRLGTGEPSPELFPREKMRQALASLSGNIDSLGYSEPKGLLPLREQISSHLERTGMEVSPSSILIVSGALQALQLVAVGLLQPGSSILLENPSYLNSLHVFQSAGIGLTGLPMDEKGICVQRVEEQKKKQQAALLYTIPSYQNPTGLLMPASRRLELLKACEQVQLPIIEDDVYRDLWFDIPPPPPLKAMDKKGLVLYMGSTSKTLSPGLRIGWVAGPESVIDRLADIKMQTDYGSSSLSQLTVAQWMSAGYYQEHLEHLRMELKRRRDFMLEWLERDFGDLAVWEIPQGGFYIWLRLLPALSMAKLFETALEQGILLNPGYLYDRNDHRHLRLSYAYASLPEMEHGMKQLARIIRQLADG